MLMILYILLLWSEGHGLHVDDNFHFDFHFVSIHDFEKKLRCAFKIYSILFMIIVIWILFFCVWWSQVDNWRDDFFLSLNDETTKMITW